MMRKSKLVRRSKEAGTAFLFLLPSMLGVIVFALIPFGDVLRRSFCEAMKDQFVGFDNFITVLENGAFQRAVYNTGRFLTVCIPVLMLFSLVQSLLLYGQKRYTRFYKTSFLLPMAIPVASVALLWKLAFAEQGLLNVFLQQIGLEKVNFLNSEKAFLILIFTYLWKNAGYDMILWLTGLAQIPGELYEAASVDGAGVWSKFRYITLPELLPTIFVISILSFINSFKVFREVYLISGDYPQEDIYMLQHLFSNWFVALDIHKMSAAAVMLVILLIPVILLFKNLDRDEE